MIPTGRAVPVPESTLTFRTALSATDIARINSLVSKGNPDAVATGLSLGVTPAGVPQLDFDSDKLFGNVTLEVGY